MNDMIGLGLTILCGYGIGKLINMLKVPSVTGYVIAGLVLGQSFLNVLNPKFLDSMAGISDLALALIAFSIGGELLIRTLKKIGKTVFTIAFFEGFSAFVLVTLAMMACGVDTATALLLGAVASATAPAATIMVLNELNAKGPLTSTLVAVVAIDDAICLMIYAVASSVSRVLIENTGSIQWGHVLAGPVLEILGAAVVGGIVGFVVAFVLNKVSYKHEMLVILLGAIMLTTGLATKLELSGLLTNMVAGAVVANLATNRQKVFAVIESVTAPIYTAFFVLAGAKLQISLLAQVGLIGLVYTVVRMAGKVTGASIGATLSKAHPSVKKYLGCGLLSQIGVAVGLAIVISNEYPGTALSSMIVTIILGTTVVTEIVGPFATRFAVKKAGEVDGGQRLAKETAKA